MPYSTPQISGCPCLGKRSKRFVTVRKTLSEKTKGGQLVFDECRYEYHVIVTNIDYCSTAEIFQNCNQCCTVETSIDEIKSCFAFDENSRPSYKCNELYLLIRMVACNLQNWSKQTILPEAERCQRITTLRRTVYHTCGMITGKGWYRHVLYQKNAGFQSIVEYMQKALCQFQIQFGITWVR